VIRIQRDEEVRLPSIRPLLVFAFLLSIEHTKICKKILGPQAHNKYIYIYIYT
jgi:hypothetical protein